MAAHSITQVALVGWTQAGQMHHSPLLADTLSLALPASLSSSSIWAAASSVGCGPDVLTPLSSEHPWS